MAHTLEFYFDFSSPFAYLGSTQAEALAARTGATLVLRPMLLGAVFKEIGTPDVPLMTWSEQKRAYYLKDLLRWAEHWGVPFRFSTRFPTNSVKALRALLALPESRRAAFMHAAFRAMWADDRDLADEATLRALLGEIGANADEILAKIGTQEIKDALFASTKRAIDAGVFGAPTWVVDEKELFWGQDRLPLVERALR
jgi:2-hydroxychromene-2-carboxylate isomerase